jgi:hypothetical protein
MNNLVLTAYVDTASLKQQPQSANLEGRDIAESIAD